MFTRLRSIKGAGGFTLVEMLTTIALLSILLAIGFPTIRSYWFRQSLNGAADAMVAEARAMQARVTAESHPLVYGMRFSTQPGMMQEGMWGLVKYDPKGVSGTPTCVQYATASTDSGVFNSRVPFLAASFTQDDGDPNTVDGTTEQITCRSSLKDDAGAPLSAGSDEFLFFYARGTATGGSFVLGHPQLGPGSNITLQVIPLTGRIEKQ